MQVDKKKRKKKSDDQDAARRRCANDLLLTRMFPIRLRTEHSQHMGLVPPYVFTDSNPDTDISTILRHYGKGAPPIAGFRTPRRRGVAAAGWYAFSGNPDPSSSILE